MVPDLKPFVKLLKQKDLKKVREWLEQNKGGLDPSDEFRKGYFLALNGMISALEVGGEMSVIKRILNGGYAQEQIEKLINDMKGRLSLKFRPRDEQGFDAAWIEVLQEFSGEKE
jgi:hypothetical protein